MIRIHNHDDGNCSQAAANKAKPKKREEELRHMLHLVELMTIARDRDMDASGDHAPSFAIADQPGRRKDSSSVD